VPYGGDFSIEAMDSHGGWLASAVDLVKFVSAVDDRPGSADILRSETIKLMLERPDLQQYAGKDEYYAKGWDVDSEEGNWRHAGALWGNSAFIMRAGKEGLNWAATFNLLPWREMENYFKELIHETFWQAAEGVKAWPEHDLFPQFAKG
jgi:N-acyl-D-amino-acid deacylase